MTERVLDYKNNTHLARYFMICVTQIFFLRKKWAEMSKSGEVMSPIESNLIKQKKGEIKKNAACAYAALFLGKGDLTQGCIILERLRVESNLSGYDFLMKSKIEEISKSTKWMKAIFEHAEALEFVKAANLEYAQIK